METRRDSSFFVFVGDLALIVYLLFTGKISRPIAAVLFFVFVVIAGILSYKGYEHPYFKTRPW